MKRYLVLFTALFTLAAAATPEDAVRTRLCDYWKYDFNSNNYVCSYLGMYGNLVEAREYEARIAELRGEIDDLRRAVDDLRTELGRARAGR